MWAQGYAGTGATSSPERHPVKSDEATEHQNNRQFDRTVAIPEAIRTGKIYRPPLE
jgi:hypothetical protein